MILRLIKLPIEKEGKTSKETLKPTYTKKSSLTLNVFDIFIYSFQKLFTNKEDFFKHIFDTF